MEIEATRAEIARMLSEGLKTETWPKAETTEDVTELVHRLQAEGADALVTDVGVYAVV